MHQQITASNDVDEEGRPAGGFAQGVGFRIDWQRGPLREQGSDEPADPNGAFVETILAVVKQRLEHYQAGPFACPENAAAIACVDQAMAVLDARTRDRERHGVEGTHGTRPTEGAR